MPFVKMKTAKPHPYCLPPGTSFHTLTEKQYDALIKANTTLQSLWTERLNRTVSVETALLSRAKSMEEGLTTPPTPGELQEWAARLGVPDDHRRIVTED